MVITYKARRSGRRAGILVMIASFSLSPECLGLVSRSNKGTHLLKPISCAKELGNFGQFDYCDRITRLL